MLKGSFHSPLTVNWPLRAGFRLSIRDLPFPSRWWYQEAGRCRSLVA
nr:MAG TPA: hypothetical protein [Crassvirales sp.]